MWFGQVLQTIENARWKLNILISGNQESHALHLGIPHHFRKASMLSNSGAWFL